MKAPEISSHYTGRQPSPIRHGQLLFEKRADRDDMKVINLAIGNVSLPMHPSMQQRMKNLGAPDSPFAEGVVKYTPTHGTPEARQAFLHIIESGGFSVDGLHCTVTDGGSQAMELMLLGVAGPNSKRPVLLMDPAYTNYVDFARRIAVPTVSARRELSQSGLFEPPDLEALEKVIEDTNPAALVVIPADNPTGQLLTHEHMVKFAKVCVKHGMWMVSDEAYRQLHYRPENATSVWALTEKEVPGITGRRISIESASKVWNACGLRIGAMVSDNETMLTKAVAEYTANLCPNAIGQYIFGALAHESADDLQTWYTRQRKHYFAMMSGFVRDLKMELPGVIVSNPDASLYSVVDFRDVAKPGFDAGDFMLYSTEKGKVAMDDGNYTLLFAPMGGFYTDRKGGVGSSQVRLAYVESPDVMGRVPRLFAQLFKDYQASL